MDFFSPSAREAAGKEAAERAFQETLARTKSTALAEKAYQAALPGTISKYLPLATGIGAVGVGTGVLPDPFKIPEQQPNETYAQYDGSKRFAAQAQFKQERPEFFGSFLASPNQGIMSTQPAYSFQPVMTAARDLDQKAWKISPVKTARLTAQARERPMTFPRCSPMASSFSRPSPFVTWAAEAVVKALPRCTS
jgi:hypothetical protein